MALGPVVDAVQRTRMSRAWAILVVYLACAVVVGGAGLVLVPSVSSQVHQFSRDSQRAVGDLRANPAVRRFDDRYRDTEKVGWGLRSLPGVLAAAAGPLRDVTLGVLGFFSDLIAVLSIAFLLILNGGRYWDGAMSALPARRADRWRRVGPRIYRAVSGYVVGNLEISVIAGVCAWAVMRLLGVPFALPLALVVAFLDLIPMVGATLGALIVALAALVVSPLTAAVWLVYSFLYQQAENYLLQPVVYGRAVKISPLVTIVGVLVGGSLLGLLGVLLAIPVAAAIQLLVQDLRSGERERDGDRRAPRVSTR
jgi:predicted PurR-regulated permease PerM